MVEIVTVIGGNTIPLRVTSIETGYTFEEAVEYSEQLCAEYMQTHKGEGNNVTVVNGHTHHYATIGNCWGIAVDTVTNSGGHTCVQLYRLGEAGSDRSKINKSVYRTLINSMDQTADGKIGMTETHHYGKLDVSAAVDNLLTKYRVIEKRITT